MFNKKKIAIIGLGYVGLPLAKSFSKFFQTVGYDIDLNLVSLFTNDPNLYGVRGSGAAGEVEISGATLTIDHPTNSELDRFAPIEKSYGIINPLLLVKYSYKSPYSAYSMMIT